MQLSLCEFFMSLLCYILVIDNKIKFGRESSTWEQRLRNLATTVVHKSCCLVDDKDNSSSISQNLFFLEKKNFVVLMEGVIVVGSIDGLDTLVLREAVV